MTGSTSVSERHAALLGLRAFVLTSPYDVPAWLSDVLMALVGAAGEPAPIKKTVRYSICDLCQGLSEICFVKIGHHTVCAHLQHRI